MKKLAILFMTIIFVATANAATAATVNLPVHANESIKNDASLGEIPILSYEWGENNHWESFFGFDLTGYLTLIDIS